MARQILSEVCRSYLIAVSAYRIWQGQPSRQAAFHDRHPAVAPAMGKLEHAREILRRHRGGRAVSPVASMLTNNNANGHAGKRDAHNDCCNGTDNIGHGSSTLVRVNRRGAQPLGQQARDWRGNSLRNGSSHQTSETHRGQQAPTHLKSPLPQRLNGDGPDPSFALTLWANPFNFMLANPEGDMQAYRPTSSMRAGRRCG